MNVWLGIQRQSGVTIVTATCNHGVIATVKSLSTVILLFIQATVLVACGTKSFQLMTGWNIGSTVQTWGTMLKKITLGRLNGQQVNPYVAAHSHLNQSVISGTIYTMCTNWLTAFGNPEKWLQKGRELLKNQHVWMRRLKSQSWRKLSSSTTTPQINVCRQLILMNSPW